MRKFLIEAHFKRSAQRIELHLSVDRVAQIAIDAWGELGATEKQAEAAVRTHPDVARLMEE